MDNFPEELRYSSEHEWVRVLDGIVRVGVTHYATGALGDIVYVSLPTVGNEVVAGDTCGELESTKSVSDLFCPVTGVVVQVNETASESPELINESPYDEGWLFEVEVSAEADFDDLLDAEGYAELVASLD